mgnify:CR=1 FL=1
MDIKAEVIEIIEELFMEDVSDMMDEDLFDAGVLDSMGTVELIVERVVVIDPVLFAQLIV